MLQEVLKQVLSMVFKNLCQTLLVLGTNLVLIAKSVGSSVGICCDHIWHRPWKSTALFPWGSGNIIIFPSRNWLSQPLIISFSEIHIIGSPWRRRIGFPHFPLLRFKHRNSLTQRAPAHIAIWGLIRLLSDGPLLGLCSVIACIQLAVSGLQCLQIGWI